jgi:glutamine synthetase
MFKNYADLESFVKKNKIEVIDFKYTDLFGRMRHLTMPASRLNEEFIKEGEAFDGSNQMGFKMVESGDMSLIPDITTSIVDPFWEAPTISMLCSIHEADTKKHFSRDPRGIAISAYKYMKETGIADLALFGPEFEFYIFDSMTYSNEINSTSYIIESSEADWGGSSENKSSGNKIPHHGGYHAAPPQDDLQNERNMMVKVMEESGIKVRYHHHEVGGPGQSEIEIDLQPIQNVGDAATWVKYIIKMVAKAKGKTATFMPKPLYNEAGSGMHFHQMLFKGDKPLFYDKDGYAGLSELALYYIGGVLKHGPSLLGITNPSTNSYKRLIPGFEAPVNLFFSLANRSAAIRVPKYANKPDEKRMEFRPPDATCNIYLALAAQLMAGLDGIKNKIDPRKEGFGPIDKNIFALPKEELANIKSLPSSLKEAFQALKSDNEYLLQGGVFTEDILDTIINWKMDKEYNEVRNRPHPYEMRLYYDL